MKEMNSILEGRNALKTEILKTAEVADYLWQNGWATAAISR